MIKLCKALPDYSVLSAEYVRISALYDVYRDDNSTLFWQSGNGTLISLCGGDMTVMNREPDTDELSGFVKMISPSTVFSDLETLSGLGLDPLGTVTVMHKNADIKCDIKGDALNSREIYDILNIDEFALPEYRYFAVDYCRRLNHGKAEYYGIKNICAAVSFNTKNYALLTGLVSREKGCGGNALKAIVSKNYGKEMLVCARAGTESFYKKYGFEALYKAASADLPKRW